jgi:hypothetical protein
MQKHILNIIFLILISHSCLKAQTPDHPRHENHYKKLPPIETAEYKLEILNAHAQMNFCIVKIKIINKTSNYLIYDPNETKFIYEHGEYKPAKGKIIIPPYDLAIRFIRVSGDYKFHVEKLNIAFEGLYLLPVDGKVYEVSEFDIPARTNYFEAGPFQCRVSGKIVQQSQLTEVPFRCTYTGDEVGLISNKNITIKFQDGKEFVSINTNNLLKSALSGQAGNEDVLFKGEEVKLLALFRIPQRIEDMRYAQMKIDFKDSFKESSLQPLYKPNFELTLDKELTLIKNK